MKYFICSDIHGSAERMSAALKQFQQLNCDYILLLGDILYHGPRNPLPPGHNPQAVASMLNEYAAHIIACRGNCEAEVDQVMLHFPVLCDSAQIFDTCGGAHRIFLSHGHIWSPEKLPPLTAGDIFLSGHTHIPVLEHREGIILCNPGSISLPKGGSQPGFAIYTPEKLSLHTLDGAVYKELVL